MQVIISFLPLSMVFIMVPRASYRRRNGEVFDTGRRYGPVAEKLPKDAKGKLNLRTLRLLILTRICQYFRIFFAAEPGQTTVGSTGSGKVDADKFDSLVSMIGALCLMVYAAHPVPKDLSLTITCRKACCLAERLLAISNGLQR